MNQRLPVFCGAMLGCLLALAAPAVGAQGQLGCSEADGRCVQRSVEVQLEPADPPAAGHALAAAWQGNGSAGQMQNNQSLRARVWTQRGNLGVGWGTDMPVASLGSQNGGGTAQFGDGPRPVVALRANVGSSTSMWVEHIGPRLDAGAVPANSAASTLGLNGAALGGPNDPTVARVGLDFKPVSRSSSMKMGIFRFQMSSTSTLAFRPRGGGMAVSYRSTF